MDLLSAITYSKTNFYHCRRGMQSNMRHISFNIKKNINTKGTILWIKNKNYQSMSNTANEYSKKKKKNGAH